MSQPARPEVGLDREPAYFYQLLRLAGLLTKECDARLGEQQDLSFSSAQVLLFLGSRSTAQQSEVATALGVTPAAITRHMVTLMTRGLLTQVQNQDNRRQNLIAITAKGRTVARNAEKVIRQTARKVSGSLDPTARHIFEESLTKILADTR